MNEKLRGTKRLDLFECARVDPDVPVEVSIAALAKLKSEGKLDHIGMSECGAETLRRAHKVCHGRDRSHIPLSFFDRFTRSASSRLRSAPSHTSHRRARVGCRPSGLDS